ncbi:MAG: isoprenylcysteine carboxylmethyltransferase family protein [Nitrospirae bacterium]|nr:isoprenylcysteine carboxylmethyltransferase family protein [Nitrospirota bacterium]
MKNDTAGIIAPPPLIYAAGLAAGLLSHAALPFHIPSSTLAVALGLCLIGVGILLAVAGFRTMGRAHTNVNPYEPTTALATDGPFRFTRNPLYLSLTLLYGGIALFANLPWAILLLPIVLLIMRRGVIDREERYLEQKFGEDYLRYKRSVRRWL